MNTIGGAGIGDAGFDDEHSVAALLRAQGGRLVALNLAATGLTILAQLILDFDLIWVVAVPLVVGVGGLLGVAAGIGPSVDRYE